MAHLFPIPTRRAVLALLGASSLTACAGDMFGSGGGSSDAPGPLTPGLPAASGAPLGAGRHKIGLVLPVSAGGQSSQIAGQLKNAAELALRSFQGADVTLLLKDDQGTTEGGQAAASAAIAEGATLIIGPLNSVSARGAAGPAKQAGVPMITFTTDVSVATKGVYLIGFLPNADVDRITAFAAQQGRKSAAALIPDDAYGSLAEASFRQSAATAGIRIMGIERYKTDLSDIAVKAQAIGKVAAQIDSLFLPDGTANAARVVQALAAAGVDRTRVKIMGTGRWNERGLPPQPELAGAWYPAPSPARVAEFNAKYRAAYGQDPMSLAILGFEAVYLAAALAGQGGDKPFSNEALLARSGFLGNTGLFRFRSDGLSERSLAVLEMSPGAPREVGPAAASFPG